ncbi:MAG TPA: hypothetical protein VF845_12275 [Terriglobales bacterium]
MLALAMVAIAALVLTRDSSPPAAQAKPRRAPLVDEQPVQTAHSKATLATGEAALRTTGVAASRSMPAIWPLYDDFPSQG